MLGDGIRRDIATISDEERTLFVNAIRALDDPMSAFVYGNNAGHEGADAAGNITYWDMQEQIHKDAHAHGIDVHAGPAFVPWHRDIVNRLEALLRKVDSRLSLHYWDWTTDPRVGTADRVAILTGTAAGSPVGFMGSSSGNAGAPFADFESTEITGDPVLGVPGDGVHDHIWRAVAPGPSPVSSDSSILSNTDFTAFNGALQNAHNSAHGYIGGTLGNAHFSFHDPMVFLLHSNMDRLWAMWQRTAGAQSRLNPATAYGTILADEGLPSTYFGEWVQPWAGIDNTGTVQTDLNPWKSDASQQSHTPYNDPSIIMPASYDTAPHSSYIVVNQDVFSTSQVSTLGSPAIFPKAFEVIYEGFEPKELGVTSTPLALVPPNLPSFTFTGASQASTANPAASYEDPSGANDVPQRITVTYDLHFANANDFPTAAGGEAFVNMKASLKYDVDTGTGGEVVNLTEVANTELNLVNQPDPYMLDIDPNAATPNPYWLSVDTRVFQVKGPGAGNPAGSKVGVTQGDADVDSNAPFTFIQSVLSNLRGDPTQFDSQFSQDENVSVLELSRSVAGQRVYNYAVARVRYRAPVTVDASNVQVFFRAFSTMVSSLDYDSTTGSSGNYRRTSNSSGAMPLLGIETGGSGPEIASIPFFAEARHADMTQQTDATNIQLISGTGGEQVAFFGCWLDLNQTDQRFPANPLADPGGPNGPFTGGTPGNPVLSIQQLMRGYHECLVAEIFFWPPGTSTDPIPQHSGPASSDRLAQRNMSIVDSSNPGWPDAHTVQHTFLVKPSSAPIDQPAVIAVASPKRRGRAAAAVKAEAAVARHVGPDELIVRWHNIPRDSSATFYFPEVAADDILSLSALRQHPAVLSKVDDHTIACRLADITYIPVPGHRTGNLAGLMSITLAPGVRAGQVYRVSVEQYSGITRKTLGAFQMTIPVKSDPDILPAELRKLSVLRYVQQGIPASSRWHGIFTRYLDQIAARVRGLGGDPTTVQPSPDGAEPPEVCPPPCPEEVCPPDLFSLNIPWADCDIEGELDLKVRFKRNCK
jgi:Common central domain of tyrosinase